MRKVIYLTLAIALLTLSLGCSSVNIFSKSETATVKILRNTPLAAEWQMYQLEITLTSGGKMPVILELANGDKVDGYYYVESGDINVGFQITANSKIYESQLTTLPEETPVSDRFSFTATQAQGIAYTLEFRNLNDVTAKTKTTIFMEIIYPGSSPVWTPIK
jgi:hypothetical protein